MRSRRSTARLTLVLIGAAALQACGREEDATRDVYQTRADCQRDWGDEEKKCEPVASGPHAGFFYGPLLYGLARSGSSAGSMIGPRPGSNAIGSAQVPRGGGAVSRGGFGSSASAHSSGG